MNRPIVTKVRIVCGYTPHDYLRIEYPGGELDIRLDRDKGAQQSLHNAALEMREQARRLQRRANLIDQARELL